MCLIALLFQVHADTPLIMAANREEFYSRGGEPPRLFDGLAAVGGQDPIRGGTWLGVNSHGLIVAVTNREKRRRPQDPDPPSRGWLVRSLLVHPTAKDAEQQAIEELRTARYEGCNIVCADCNHAAVLHAGDELRIEQLPPGIHVVANRDVNDPFDARVAQVRDWFGRHELPNTQQTLEKLQRLCASPTVCFRLDDRGTVSSSILALANRASEAVYLHAQGSPSETAYDDYSDLLRSILRLKGNTS